MYKDLYMHPWLCPPMRTVIEEVDRSKVTKPIIADEPPGRNDPCPCGSGRKWKHCHGRK